MSVPMKSLTSFTHFVKHCIVPSLNADNIITERSSTWIKYDLNHNQLLQVYGNASKDHCEFKGLYDTNRSDTEGCEYEIQMAIKVIAHHVRTAFVLV